VQIGLYMAMSGACGASVRHSTAVSSIVVGATSASPLGCAGALIVHSMPLQNVYWGFVKFLSWNGFHDPRSTGHWVSSGQLNDQAETTSWLPVCSHQRYNYKNNHALRRRLGCAPVPASQWGFKSTLYRVISRFNVNIGADNGVGVQVGWSAAWCHGRRKKATAKSTVAILETTLILLGCRRLHHWASKQALNGLCLV
jgi:hypothetical protein